MFNFSVTDREKYAQLLCKQSLIIDTLLAHEKEVVQLTQKQLFDLHTEHLHLTESVHIIVKKYSSCTV